MSWTDILRSKKLRATPQRLMILSALERLDQSKQHAHVTARQVLEEVLPSLPGINATTVYRTLEDLNGAGIVDIIAHSRDQVRFALRHQHARHGHLVCRRCEAVEVLDLAYVTPLAQQIKDHHGFLIDQDHLTLVGLCKSCLELTDISGS